MQTITKISIILLTSLVLLLGSKQLMAGVTESCSFIDHCFSCVGFRWPPVGTCNLNGNTYSVVVGVNCPNTTTCHLGPP